MLMLAFDVSAIIDIATLRHAITYYFLISLPH